MICNLILIDAYNFPKTPLELHKGLALVVDASFAVLTSQRKLIVHWKETGIKHNSSRNLFFLYTTVTRQAKTADIQTIMRAQTSQNFGFLQ